MLLPSKAAAKLNRGNQTHPMLFAVGPVAGHHRRSWQRGEGIRVHGGEFLRGNISYTVINSV